MAAGGFYSAFLFPQPVSACHPSGAHKQPTETKTRILAGSLSSTGSFCLLFQLRTPTQTERGERQSEAERGSESKGVRAS